MAFSPSGGAPLERVCIEESVCERTVLWVARRPEEAPHRGGFGPEAVAGVSPRGGTAPRQLGWTGGEADLGQVGGRVATVGPAAA